MCKINGNGTTLENIHRAAKAEFLEKGYKDASLRNIVKSVGMTTGAFYGYYKSKEELFESNFSTIYSAQTIPLAIYSIIFLIPIIVLTVKWFIEYYKIQNNKVSKYIICIFPFTLIGLLLSMYLMCDWGRLFVMYGFAIFFSFITLWSIDRINVIRSIDNITTKIDKNIKNIYFVSLCVFYMFLTLYGSSSTTLFDFGIFLI